MQSILINGDRPLHGEILVSGSKNASLPIIVASLLTDQIVHLSNIPRLTDIYTVIQLLRNHGAEIEVIDNDNGSISSGFDLKIQCNNITNFTAPYDIVCKMRASFWVLGPLLARFGQAVVSLPGGCAIGARQVDLYITLLEAMGASIKIENGYVYATTKTQLQGIHFHFNKISVGATITGVMTATLSEGETILTNCAQEPEIQDLCHCLNSMGAKIDGIGTNILKIQGQQKLHATNATSYKVMNDRIEAGTYMIAGAITKGDLSIKGVEYEIVENFAFKLIESGFKVYKLDNGVRVQYDGHLKAVNIQTNPYPGIATDLQAQLMSLMCIANGTSVITENIFENRFMHVPELCRMGAKIAISGDNAIVHGVSKLNGAEVTASDLRASVSLVLAGLTAKGQTKVRRLYHLDRGYQSLEQKLSNCGADIKRVND